VIVRVVPYDPGWLAEYEAESTRIGDALGKLAVGRHHIGSTAIPGISAKPIIDILLEVPDVAELDAHVARMESLGYEAMGECGIPGRRYFRRDNPPGVRTHQVHAFKVGSAHSDRHLAFRDYMIAHSHVAQAYGEVKQRLAELFPDDINAYMAGKDAFVKRHEAAALAWRADRTTTDCGGQ
jgi:GrpB-like predicted nucleotidyltransferase (UPF0157 family)